MTGDDRPRGKPLAVLARAAGVQTSYVDTEGVRHRASADALLGVLEALGVDVADRDHAAEAHAELRAQRGGRLVEPVAVAWDGTGEVALAAPTTGKVELEVVLEDGASLGHHVDAEGQQALPLPAELPVGVHHLVARGDGRTATATVLSAPTRLGASSVARARRVGVFAPTYALRRQEHDRGTGDLGDLELLAEWADEHGAALVATLPLLPTYLGTDAEPFDPSPYNPVSRLAWGEVHLDLSALADVGPPPPAGELVDWRAQGAHVRAVLDAEVERLGDRGLATVDAWIDERPELAAYARFRALTERNGPWPSWPDQPAAPDPAAERRHRVAQWAADTQLGALADALDRRGQLLYLDLPIGTHPDGFDTWQHPELFVRGTRVGAPPDGFFAGGQDWGFPPLHPEASRADGHAHLRAAVAHHLRHARVLRIDHVMALHRLWWVPPGLPATHGAYVRYPADELYAAVLVEAHRAGAEVVGEDLGTVPGSIRAALGRHGFGGMYAAQFTLPEEVGDEPPPPRRRDLALLGTHDTATFAAWWAESPSRRDAVVAWLEEEGTEVDPDDPRDVLDALQQWLGRGPARWVLANLEDLWGETVPQNRPGLGPDDFPSWRRRAARPVDDLGDAADLIDSLHASRGGRP